MQLGDHQIDHQIFMEVVFHMPDHRKRDLDNYCKALLDAITKAGLWDDDSMVDQLHLYRGAVTDQGSCHIIIHEAGPIIPDGVSP